MERGKGTKTSLREEDHRRRRKGLYSKKGNICEVEGSGIEEGGVSGYVSGEDGVGEDRGDKGTEPCGMEGPEQEAGGHDEDFDGAIKEEREWGIDKDDITGVIRLIEIENPELDRNVKKAKEIRRSTKERKKLADEMNELLFSLMI